MSMPCSSKTNNISNDLADISEVIDNSKNMATTTTVINENSESADNFPLVHHQSHSTRGNSILNVPARKLLNKDIVIDSSCAEESRPADGRKIIESEILLTMINTCSKCPNCGAEKNLSLEQCEKKRKGLCEELCLGL